MADDVPRDLCIHARNGDIVHVVRVVWQLHSEMVRGWTGFHRGTTLPEVLDLSNLDGQAVRVFDAWCLHQPLWKTQVTASLFGPCMELASFLVVPAEFVTELLSIAYCNVSQWDWRDILPFLDMAPDNTYADIVKRLLRKYEHGNEGWWCHNYPVCNQRLLACTYDWLCTSRIDHLYHLTFALFLSRKRNPEIKMFLESRAVRRRLMRIAIINAGVSNRGHLINFWKTNPSWVSISLGIASSMAKKSHFVNALTKLQCNKKDD